MANIKTKMEDFINESSDFFKSNKFYTYEDDIISVNYKVDDIHKNLILKIGNDESPFSKLTFKNFYKKELWKELNLLPYLSDLETIDLIEEVKSSKAGYRLTKQGKDYFNFLNKK